MLFDRSLYVFDRRVGDGSGHCYRIEAVMHLIDVMAMVMDVTDIVIGLKLIHVIDVIAMLIEVMDIVIGSKL